MKAKEWTKQMIVAEAETNTVAHNTLRLVGDRPGQYGRLRVARIVVGFPVVDVSGEDHTGYVTDVDWTLHTSVELVDTLIAGGFIAQEIGMRPTLVLTRAGHRALDALEALNEKETS